MKYQDPNGLCIICNKRGVDLHHLVSRGANGCDSDFNLARLCRTHHQEIHKIGRTTFAKKYQQMKQWLIKMGWQLINSKWYGPFKKE
jgi:hypothetical protein